MDQYCKNVCRSYRFRHCLLEAAQNNSFAATIGKGLKMRKKRIGLSLIGLGMLLYMVTAALMIYAFDSVGRQPNSDASALAETISSSVIPGGVGVPLVVVGLIVFIIGYFEDRIERRMKQAAGL